MSDVKQLNSYMININDIEKTLPFITCVRHKDVEYIGIIQNTNDKFITMYDYDNIRTETEKKVFIELGALWWYDSNRILPLNIFLHEEMRPFRDYLKTISIKDSTVVFGPVTSLRTLMKKRTKKRQISLVRKP